MRTWSYLRLLRVTSPSNADDWFIAAGWVRGYGCLVLAKIHAGDWYKRETRSYVRSYAIVPVCTCLMTSESRVFEILEWHIELPGREV